MTDEQIAEKVLEDVFKRAASEKPADVVPMAIFASCTAYASMQVLPDLVQQSSTRRILNIRRIMDEKIAARHKARTSILSSQN